MLSNSIHRNHNALRHNNPFKKKYHSRNKCSIIDSPIFSSYIRDTWDVFVDQSISMRFEDVFLFATNYFIEQSDAVREITLTTDLALLVFRCFCERETRNRSVTKVDRDDLSWRPIDYRNWIIARGPTPFRSTS